MNIFTKFKKWITNEKPIVFSNWDWRNPNITIETKPENDTQISNRIETPSDKDKEEFAFRMRYR